MIFKYRKHFETPVFSDSDWASHQMRGRIRSADMRNSKAGGQVHTVLEVDGWRLICRRITLFGEYGNLVAMKV